MEFNENNMINRIEEICRILKTNIESEDKHKLSAELEKLLLDVTHNRRSRERNITRNK